MYVYIGNEPNTHSVGYLKSDGYSYYYEFAMKQNKHVNNSFE